MTFIGTITNQLHGFKQLVNNITEVDSLDFWMENVLRAAATHGHN